MNHYEHKRARDDASEQDDRSAEPRAIHHARRHLNDLAGNERHDDLHELHSQKDEESQRARVAHVVDHAAEPARLEDFVDVGPKQDHDYHHERQKCDKPAEPEDVAARHLATADRRDFLRLLAHRFATFVSALLYGLATLAFALALRHSFPLTALIVR